MRIGIINNTARSSGFSVFAGVMSEPEKEMIYTMRERVNIKPDNLEESQVALVYGQMNEPPGASASSSDWSTPPSSFVTNLVRMLFFVDTIYLPEAGSEVSVFLVVFISRVFSQHLQLIWEQCRNG